MTKPPLALRILLFFINLKPLDPHIPLNKTRRMVNGFMRLADRLFGLRTRHFYGIADASLVSGEGHRIKLKIYTPVKQETPLPVCMYFHGGGFAHGGYDLRKNFAKAIAAKANCIVVSVEYRLAPEHPFPAALNDCYEASLWVSENAGSFNGDGTRLAVVGESAGGTLAGTVALLARDNGKPAIAFQALLYPATEGGATEYPSMNENANGYMLTKALIEQYGKAYITDASASSPYRSLANIKLDNLPPALVITCGLDPLRDEAEAYVHRLKEAGVKVRHKRYNNMVHDFILMMPRFLPEAREAIDMIAEELRKAFNP